MVLDILFTKEVFDSMAICIWVTEPRKGFSVGGYPAIHQVLDFLRSGGVNISDVSEDFGEKCPTVHLGVVAVKILIDVRRHDGVVDRLADCRKLFPKGCYLAVAIICRV